MRREKLWWGVAYLWACSIQPGCGGRHGPANEAAPGTGADGAPSPSPDGGPDGVAAPDRGGSQDAGAGPEVAGAAAHPDGATATQPLTVAGACDQELPSPGAIGGTEGTLANTGPYHPCAVVGGQAFRSMRFSSDGRWVAALGAGGQVVVLDGASLAPQAAFARDRGAYSSFAISADGSLIAAGAERDGELDVWRVADHALLRAVDLGPTWPSLGGAAAFSSDDTLVAASAQADTVILDIASGVTRRIAEVGSGDAIFFVDGDRKIVSERNGYTTVGSGNYNVALTDVGTGMRTVLVAGGPFEEVDLLASSDGRVFVTRAGELAIWDAATATKRVLPQPPWQAGRLELIGLSADGGEIGVALGDSAGLWFQRRRASDNAPIDELRLLDGAIKDWSSRAGTVLVGPAYPGAGTQVAVIDWRATEVRRRACSGPAATWPIGFSRDGARLLFGWPDGPPMVVDVASGEPLAPGLLTTPGNDGSAALSPDGRLVAWVYRTWGTGANLLSQELRLTGVPGGDTRTLLASTDGMFSEPGTVFSADAQLVAAVDWSSGAIAVFDTASGERLAQLIVGDGGFVPLGFTADGAAIRVARGSDVRTVSWRDGADVSDWTVGSGASMNASADGSSAVTFDIQGPLQSYRQGVLVATMPAPDDTCFGPSPWARLSPDGSVVGYTYTCSRPFLSRNGLTTKIYDAVSGALVQATLLENPIVFSWDAGVFATSDTIWCRR